MYRCKFTGVCDGRITDKGQLPRCNSEACNGCEYALKQITGIDDSGKREDLGTGAVREDASGKGRPDLISPFALWRLAKWYELGAMKYADRNWEKGMKFSRYTASMFRHLLKWMMGDKSEDHLAAIMWNAAAIIHHQELGQAEFDDMPNYLSK